MKAMDERSWELYRLSVVESMEDGPLKRALVESIQHKLKILTRGDEYGKAKTARSGSP